MLLVRLWNLHGRQFDNYNEAKNLGDIMNVTEILRFALNDNDLCV